MHPESTHTWVTVLPLPRKEVTLFTIFFLLLYFKNNDVKMACNPKSLRYTTTKMSPRS